MDFYVPDELKKNVALAAFGSVTREEMVRYSDGDLIMLRHSWSRTINIMSLKGKSYVL